MSGLKSTPPAIPSQSDTSKKFLQSMLHPIGWAPPRCGGKILGGPVRPSRGEGRIKEALEISIQAHNESLQRDEPKWDNACGKRTRR